MRNALSVAAAGLLALSACAGAGIKVVRASDEKLPPKPADCALEFLKDPPKQPYDDIADLESHVTSPPTYGAGALEVLRPKACELGADAVIVRRNFVTNEFGHVMVAGTAIKYRPEEAAPAEKPEQPEAPGAPTNL